ncbi:MAG: Peptide-methionine (S)-S-oxide reductase MsrA, partial [uncultured Nocardioidaceae bacterium]
AVQPPQAGDPESGAGPDRSRRAALPPPRATPRPGRSAGHRRVEHPGRLRGGALRPRVLLGCRGGLLEDPWRVVHLGRLRRRQHPEPVVR